MKTNTQNIARKIFFLFSFFYILNANAQAPDKMSYQAVIRNASNALVANTGVGIKISILQTTATGTVVYAERQTPTTNANGLATIQIGSGTVLSGAMATIDWGAGPYFIKTETDPTGGTNYTITSTTQLMSVPYALYAKTAGSTTSTNAWGLSGNTGTTAANFIGTTDDKDLQLKVNNQKAGVIESDDNTENTIKNANTAFGYQSLNSNTTGYFNTAFGFQSLYSNTTGIHNTAIGQNTLFSNTEGNFNEAIGQKCLYSNTTGSRNSANGYKALFSNTTGSFNLANGYHALYFNTTGYANVANGHQSLYSNTTGYANVAYGNSSLYSNTTGNYNVANGYQSLNSNTTGNYNVANGSGALGDNTTGYNNVANGGFALKSNTTGYNNVANGSVALYSNTTGAYNAANGYKSLYSNTTGAYNVANGTYALELNTIGNFNVANGSSALNSNTTGNENVANGSEALYSNTIGYENVANGYQSLYSNTTGNANVANGSKALYNNTSGTGNSAYGEKANSTNTTGWDNIGVGFHTLGGIDTNGNRILGNKTGNQNVAIGAFAGDNIGSNTNGSLFLGTNAKATTNNTNLTNATAIGNKATVGQDNSIILGAVNGINGATADTKVGIGVTAPLTSLDVNGQILTRDRVILGQTGPSASPTTSPIWAMDNSNNNFRIFNQPNISSSGSTYLSIAPNGNATLSGFTQLGESSPNIKVKKLTGVFSNVVMEIPHGLDVNKILSVSIFVTVGSTKIPPFFNGSGSNTNLNFYSYQIYNDKIWLNCYYEPVNGPSNRILNHSYTITIMYEE